MTKENVKPISRDMVFLDQDLETKEAVLDLLVEQAKKAGFITETEPFLAAVLKREEEAPTAVGHQVAIPHGKSEVVTRPFIGFVQTKNDFLWSKEEEEKVKLIFMIGVPQENEDNIHLKFISQLSRKLMDDEFRQAIGTATDVDQAFGILDQINTDL